MSKLRPWVFGALLAALYVVLTLISSAFGLSFGAIQLRFSEALVPLAALGPWAVLGLSLGCFIANIPSALGPLDMLVGTAATLAAGFLTLATKKVKIKEMPVLAPVWNALINGLAVGAEISIIEGFSLVAYATAALSVGVSEFIMVTLLGLPLYLLVYKAGGNRLGK